jgi:hypothetical protein
MLGSNPGFFPSLDKEEWRVSAGVVVVFQSLNFSRRQESNLVGSL